MEENLRKGRYNSADKIELRSKEIQEILSRPPKWLIRYGIGIIFVVIVVVFVGSYFIEYPDMIKGKVVLISKQKAKIIVPIQNSGKIKNNQTINIKFDNYPYMEYGILKTQISNLKLLPSKDSAECYEFLISLPDTLKTNYNTTLPYISQMQGSAEIIIENKRLLHKFIQIGR
ncbi:MAG: hypothetical protein Q4Q06_06330 [Bacteroidota bacterium]|nr:hypothetical protein [Bacteroidota bacterium]